MNTTAKVALVFFIFIVNVVIYQQSIDGVIASHQLGVNGYEVVSIERQDDLSSRYEYVYTYTIYTDQTRSYSMMVDEVTLTLANDTVHDEYGLISSDSTVVETRSLKDIKVYVVEVRIRIESDVSDEARLIASELRSIDFKLSILENQPS